MNLDVKCRSCDKAAERLMELDMSQAKALKAALETNEHLEIVIHGIRRMAESECDLKSIIDACEAEFPESESIGSSATAETMENNHEIHTQQR